MSNSLVPIAPHVSMSVHIKHLGSEVSRILGSRNFAQREPLTLQEIFHKQETKLDVFHATQSRFLYAAKLWPYCQSVKPTSTQSPTLLPQHR